MLRIYIKVIISLLFMTVSLSATADGPDYFSIRGVAYNDVLWMHPKPDYKSPRIQGIPPNASCVKNMGCYKRWCKVSYRGVIGWVNGKYLGEGGCAQSYKSTPKKQKSSYYNETIQQTMKLPQLTWGACMLICEDNKFCKKADYNSQTSMCTLSINTSHPSYQRIVQRCSHIPSSNWRASYQNDRWQIGCPN